MQSEQLAVVLKQPACMTFEAHEYARSRRAEVPEATVSLTPSCGGSGSSKRHLNIIKLLRQDPHSSYTRVAIGS